MGSFGQGGFGEAPFGGNVPTDVLCLNLSGVGSRDPQFTLAADHQIDVHEHLWLEAFVKGPDRTGALVSINTPLHQRIDVANFSKAMIDTLSVSPEESVVVTMTGLFLAPNKPHFLYVRATSDPLGEASPSDQKWYTRWFPFQFIPTLTDWDETVLNFKLWENKNKDLAIAQDGSCRSSVPFAEWDFDPTYENVQFVWNVTPLRMINDLPFVTNLREVDLAKFAIYDGIWWLKVAPIWSGVMGAIYEHRFIVEGCDIIVD